MRSNEPHGTFGSVGREFAVYDPRYPARSLLQEIWQNQLREKSSLIAALQRMRVVLLRRH
jgi:hypothetical protein